MKYLESINILLKEHLDVINEVSRDAELINGIDEFCTLVVRCYNEDGKILLCGNGGSASDAQHIAAEWQGRYLMERRPLHAEALHANTSYLTAVANDYGFEHVFSRAVDAQGKKGDILVGLTTSGNSPNVVAALKMGKEKGMICVGMTGNKPNADIEPYCDLTLKVPSSVTARIQEMHILIGHIVCELSEKALFNS
ncbi:MAG: SIS domain-containing protein [Saprospiraceae bacterium]|nr:SIS domain-containing protein [Saprospiraceae bacterium]